MFLQEIKLLWFLFPVRLLSLQLSLDNLNLQKKSNKVRVIVGKFSKKTARRKKKYFELSIEGPLLPFPAL